ncbi:hypothetical protein FHG87_012264 [Trinorchestia longiramus]|nr:hypothetical protein FHG87_012264 [Trinorchestia longiramus]
MPDGMSAWVRHSTINGSWNVMGHGMSAWAAEAMASSTGELNLPNVPGMVQQPFVYPTGGPAPFSYPAGAPPPPPAVEPGEDALLPPTRPQYPGGASNWDEMLGLDTSPPPPYASIDGNAASPSAPPPSLPSNSPPQTKLDFPPDVPTSDEDRKVPPQPSPRSRFDVGGNSSAAGDDIGFSLPDLPNVPSVASNNNHNNDPSPSNTDDIDFDDLNKRFMDLKKKK